MSLHVTQLRPRTLDAVALRYVNGLTSKQDILEFCPGANVGAPVNDDLDLQWIVIPTGILGLASESHHQVSSNGDWIIKHANGTYEVLSHQRMTERYEVVGTVTL